MFHIQIIFQSFLIHYPLYLLLTYARLWLITPHLPGHAFLVEAAAEVVALYKATGVYGRVEIAILFDVTAKFRVVIVMLRDVISEYSVIGTSSCLATTACWQTGVEAWDIAGIPFLISKVSFHDIWWTLFSYSIKTSVQEPWDYFTHCQYQHRYE